MLGGKQRSSQTQFKERDKKAEIAKPSISGTPHTIQRSFRRSAHRQRDVGLLLVALMLGVVAILAFSNGGTQSSTQTNRGQADTTASVVASVSTTSETSTPLPVEIMRAAQQRLYPFPSSNVGLMQPSVDSQGNVWVGEMYANRLARLNWYTGAITTWEPPGGKYGIMTTAIDAQGDVWFVEQGANYIGRFDPVTQTFRTFLLGNVHGHPLGPQDLQFDARGLLWFTAVVGGRIGRLDPTSGVVQTWPVPSLSASVQSMPFSLTVTAGGQVWFGEITGGGVGHLDPSTGRITLYRLANAQVGVFSMAHDTKGRIWFTEIAPGTLGMIDTTTNRLMELPVPAISGKSAALYGLVVTPDGNVWFVDNGADALARFTPGKASYTFFGLALPSSAPFGLTLDVRGKLWFTVSGSSANSIGEIAP